LIFCSTVDPPIIRQAFSEEILHPGNPVFIKCIAGGNPTPEISWELDGKKIANSERFQAGQYVTVNGDVVSFLNITSAQTKDGGLYKCIAASKVGVVEHAAKLKIHGLPYVRPMEKKSIVSGETLIVTCPVAGHPSMIFNPKIVRTFMKFLSQSNQSSGSAKTASCRSTESKKSSPTELSSSKTSNETRIKRPTLA
jgi:hypothetical protein